VSRIFLVSPIVLARCCVHRRPEYTDATRAGFHFHCSRLQMEMQDRCAGHRGGWGPRRRQSSKLLEAKRKCRQRARHLRVSTPDCRLPCLPWLLVKVFWLRDDSQVYTTQDLTATSSRPSRLWRFARNGRRPT
jgi:hypothetical protein